MIGLIQIRERGATPGILKREFNRVSKTAWLDSAAEHHTDTTHKRFTPEHARKANYTRRKGELLPRGSKAFKRSYYGRKWLRADRGGGPERADPLVYTGHSQRRSRFPSITSTSTRARLRFDVPAFNFRHPKSRVRMSEEFRRILPPEERAIAEGYDRRVDRGIDTIRLAQTTTIT